ncbi:MAG: S1C family serine protease [Trueperaceae bacterium]
MKEPYPLEPSQEPTAKTQNSEPQDIETQYSKPQSVQYTDFNSPAKVASSKFSVPRRLTWLLFGFFLATALFAWQVKPVRVYQYQHAQLALPEIEPPTGEFITVYERARPATLQIETRSGDPSYLGAPLGLGTGFFISEDGYVATAYHVVDRSEASNRADVRRSIQYVAVAPDKTEYPLELVGFDAYFDLAILKATVSESVPFLPLATGDATVGEEIVAIGSSRMDFLEGRAGVISRIGVARPRARFADGTIELSAALAPGDSGGPVLNRNGEAIGVVSFISFIPDSLTSQDDTENVVPPFLRGLIEQERDFAAYAVPVSADSDMIAALKIGEKNDIPVIGFSGPPVQTGLPDSYAPEVFRQQKIDLGRLPGPIVWEVRPNGPADKAGLRDIVVDEEGITAADIIVAIDNEATPTFNDLIEKLYLKGVGETVTVTVQRGDATFKLRMELGAKSEVFN